MRATRASTPASGCTQTCSCAPAPESLFFQTVLTNPGPVRAERAPLAVSVPVPLPVPAPRDSVVSGIYCAHCTLFPSGARCVGSACDGEGATARGAVGEDEDVSPMCLGRNVTHLPGCTPLRADVASIRARSTRTGRGTGTLTGEPENLARFRDAH